MEETGRYYLLQVVGDVEPQLHGPYSSTLMRDREALRIRMSEGDRDGLYKVSVDERGRPSVDSYLSMEFELIDLWREVEVEAEREGWTIFEIEPATPNGERFTIQKIDDPEVGHASLTSDDEAWALVVARFHTGDPSGVHARAIKLLAELSPVTTYHRLRAAGAYVRQV